MAMCGNQEEATATPSRNPASAGFQRRRSRKNAPKRSTAGEPSGPRLKDLRYPPDDKAAQAELMRLTNGNDNAEETAI